MTATAHSKFPRPPAWISIKFGDLFELSYGKSLTKKNRNSSGGNFPVYGSNGIVDSHNEYFVEGPAIIVGRKGAAGAVCFSSENCWPIDTTYYVKPSQFLDIRFCYYLIKSLRLDQFEKSTAIPGLSRADAYDLVINIPPFPEQKRIVVKIEELFSELDDGVESLKTAQGQLEVYRQALLKSAFEGKITAQWRVKNKSNLHAANQLIAHIKKSRDVDYHERLSSWGAETDRNGGKPRPPKILAPLGKKDLDELPSLPEGWIWEKLGWMTCSVEYGTAAKSSEHGDVPVLRMGNIQNARFDWSNLVYTSDAEEIRKYSLRQGDVLFNRTNSPELVGKTAIYRGERPAVFAGYLIRVNQIRTIVDSQYLNLFLNSHIARQQGNRVKTDGVNQSNINGDKLTNYPFPYCSLAEQREIVKTLEEKLSIVDQFEEEIALAVDKAEALRSSILKKAFSGKLVAQDQNDEPASVLLERIRSEVTVTEHLKKKIKRKDAA